MTTVRQIEKLWEERKYNRLIAEVLAARVESAPPVHARLSGSSAAAALAIIRLDEIDQSHHPIAQKLLRAILASQGSDGGWNDPMLAALCLRALMCSRGQGLAIERGLRFLADLQKSEGIWPATPLRRMPADPLVSAFILLQLVGKEASRKLVRFVDALAWFDRNDLSLDSETAKLWNHAATRSRVQIPARASAFVSLS